MRNFLTDIVGMGAIPPVDAKPPLARAESRADAALDREQGKPVFIDTALQPTDDAPTFDDDGYTEMDPRYLDEEEMLDALENPSSSDPMAALPPQEAYDAMKFQAPLSDEEIATLEDTPFLEPSMTWVDDPDHDEWMYQRSKEKYGAMDKVLEDEMYGDGQLGEELGFSLSSLNPVKAISRAARGIAKGVTSAAALAARGVTTAAQAVAHGARNVAHYSKMVALYPARKLEGLAKMVASAAAFPIKRAARPLVMTTAMSIAKKNGRAVPTAGDRQAASRIAVSVMKRNGNPLVKFGGLVLGWVGTGVSGTMMGRDAYGRVAYRRKDVDMLGGETEIGMTGLEIAALAGATAAAISLVMHKLTGSASQAVGAPAAPAIDPNTGMPATAMDPSMAQPGMDPSMMPQPGMDPSMMPQPGMDPSAVDPSMMQQPSMDPSMMAQPADPSAMDPSMMDPNAYTSGDDMSNADENIDTLIYGEGDDTLIFGDEGDDTLIFGDEGDDTLIFGDDYEFMVGGKQAFDGFAGDVLGRSGSKKDDARHPRGTARTWRSPSISGEKFKALTVKQAQTTSGNEAPSAKHLVKAHQYLAGKLKQKGVKVRAPKGTPPGTSSGAWLYKLSPLYWTKSSEEKQFIDAEKANWEKTKELNKRAGKRGDVLELARRAEYQAEQAHAAQAKAEAIDTELKDIQESISQGSSIVGGNAEMTSIIGAAAAQGRIEARKTAGVCSALAAKIEAGQKLSSDELAKLRSCLKMTDRLTKLHDSLHAKTSAMGYRDDKGITTPFLGGENVQEIMGAFVGENVQEIMGKSSGYNDILGAAPAGRTRAQWIALTAVAATQPKNLPKFLKDQKISLSKADLAKLKTATRSARAIMSHPQYQKLQLNTKALSQLSGEVDAAAGDEMGSFFGALGKVLTAPLAATALAASALTWGVNHVVLAPAKLVGKISNWGAKKAGWSVPGYGGGARPGVAAVPGAPGIPGAPPAAMPTLPPGMSAPPPPPSGLSPQLQAAYQNRQIAAYQRIQAAQAQSTEAQQQLAASADASNAEADALEAEAQARQDQQAATQAQYDIAPTDESGGEDEILGADWFAGIDVQPIAHDASKDMTPAQRKKFERAAMKANKANKILVEAQKNTPTGKKIRAGATLYRKAAKGHAPSRVAIAKMHAKAKTGDPQAKRDVNAVRAGKIAVHSKVYATKHAALKARLEASRKRGIANRKKVEAKLGNRLAEHTRRKKLVQHAKVEYRAAHGDKKAKKLIAYHVHKAKAGDKKAAASVAAYKLARHVRTSAKNPQDLKRQRQAGKMIAKARHGNKKAIRQLALIDHAAKAGQPNAKRAMKHLQVAAHIERTVSTGKVSLPGSKKPAPAKVAMQRKAELARYQMLKARVATPMGTKEEALAAAKIAQKMGLKEEAGALAMRARKLRSAKAPIKDTAAVVAAAEGGNQEARAVLSDSLASAERGEPKGISSAGKIAGVQAIAAVNKGMPMPQPIAEATHIVERAQAGDPEAKRIVAKVGEAAQNPSHPDHAAAVEKAVALTAASTVLAATAANVVARNHWRTEARKATGTHVPANEKEAVKAELDEKVAKLRSGEGTYSDGVKARDMAMALGMAPLAAQISAIMPPADTNNPMSSLPTPPLRPIRGWSDFLAESLRALTLSTPDPFENYREGALHRASTPMFRPLANRGRVPTATSGAFVGGSGVTPFVVKRASEGDTSAKKKLFSLVLKAKKGDTASKAELADLKDQVDVALGAGQLDKGKVSALHDELYEFLATSEVVPAKM